MRPWLLLAILLMAPGLAQAQGGPRSSSVQVALGGGFLTSGAYFTGPGETELTNGDAFAGSLQVSVPVQRSLAVVMAGTHARPEWRLTGVPLVGTVGFSGARLWFADVALRGQMSLGSVSPTAPTLFAQAGPGVAHYAVDGSVLGRRVDEHATNFAVALAAGLALPFTERFGIEVMAKDYIASFESVRDLEDFGVDGRRAHTLVMSVSGRLGL